MLYSSFILHFLLLVEHIPSNPLKKYAAAKTIKLQYVPEEWGYQKPDDVLAKEESLKKATAKTTMTADGTLTDNSNSMDFTGVNNTLTVQFNNLPAGYQNNIAFCYNAKLENGDEIEIRTAWAPWETDNQIIYLTSKGLGIDFEILFSGKLENEVTYDIANTYINPLLKCFPIIDNMMQTGATSDEMISTLADMMKSSYGFDVRGYIDNEDFSNPAQSSIISSELMVGVEYEYQGGESLNMVGIFWADNSVETPTVPPVETPIETPVEVPVETPVAPETAVPTVQTNDIEKFDPVFNSTYYASSNPDVAAAFGTDEALLFSHFLTFGMAEGRLCNEEFNVQVYKAANPDLVAAFGDDLTSYYVHYINCGQAEGRVAK